MMKLQTDLDVPKIWIDMKVETPEGIILQNYFEEGHSWVHNFYAVAVTMMEFDEILVHGIKKTNGDDVSGRLSINGNYTGSAGTYGYTSGTGGATGIRLGTSGEAFHVGDFHLYSIIGHGTGTGQLYHQSQSKTYSYDYSNQTVKTTLVRIFNNNSNGTIVIREAGIYFSLSVPGETVLMSRDVLSVPITVPHGTLLTVTYTLTSPSLRYLRELPVIGTKGSGGYYAGQMYNGGFHTHRKYGFIVAPITGEGSGLQAQTSGTTSGATGDYNGISNTQTLVGLGAGSPIGSFCNDKNNDSPPLNNYSDWYIPSTMEMQILFPRIRSLMDSVDAFTNANYYSSTELNSSNQYYGNPVTSSWSYMSKTTQARVRLIRKILVDEFVPDVIP